MNKAIEFGNLGGYPLDQEALQFMQQSYTGALSALAQLAGDKVILVGVEESAGMVSSGWIVLNGEIIPFIGGPVGTDVVISTLKEPVEFFDGAIREVYSTKSATCGFSGGFPFADLKPLTTLLNIREQLTQLLEDFAEHSHSWAAITDKPNGYITHLGSLTIGDIPDPEGIFTAVIPDQGGTNYRVVGSLRGISASHAIDNDVSWVVRELTAESFKISIREYAAVGQNLVFDYIIVKTL